MSDAEWDCDEGEPDAHRFARPDPPRRVKPVQRSLPKSFVLRAHMDRRYLDATGRFTPFRRDAVRLSHKDASKFLFLAERRHSDPLFGLTIEECSKKERRVAGPISEAEAGALYASMVAARKRVSAAELIREAEQHERTAAALREKAEQLRQAAQAL
jgi:hypothetical protein